MTTPNIRPSFAKIGLKLDIAGMAKNANLLMAIVSSKINHPLNTPASTKAGDVKNFFTTKPVLTERDACSNTSVDSLKKLGNTIT